MAFSFPGFPWRFWGDGSKDKQPVSNGSSLNSLNSSSSDWGLGLRESETVKFQTKIAPAKGEGKWQGCEERGVVDKEFDIVVVPSDGVHLSGFEPEGPEWSIGWEEPHGPGFQDDGGFAVLVRCYRLGCRELVEGRNNQLLSAIKNLPMGSLLREATLCSSGFLLFRTSESLEVPDRVTVDEVYVNISARGTLEEVILL